MYLIFLTLTLGLLWLNLAALTVQSRKLLPNYHLARSSGLLLLVLVLFFVEHFIGLGKITWIWPLTSTGAILILWKSRHQLKKSGFWRSETIFILAFLYAFGWRFSFPNIYLTSERITDLYFISNYISGATLPPLDNWYPPHMFHAYYAFQHYAAALMGRILGMDIGMTYNIAFGLLMALPITLAWSVSGYFIKQYWTRVLLVLTLVVGGTGLSPLLDLVFLGPRLPMKQSEVTMQAYEQAQASDALHHMIMSARFIGLYDERAHEGEPITSKAMAEAIFPIEHYSNGDYELRELPLENFGYQFFVGDYHPPLGSFFLLLLTFALIISVKTKTATNQCQALLGLSLPVMIIMNTWIFPLQAVLLLGWIAYCYWSKQPPDWTWLIGGGLFGAGLIYPFLTDFAHGSLSPSIKITSDQDHTPIARFVALFWPLLLLIGLSLFNRDRRKLSLAMAVTFSIMLLLSEFIFVDGPPGGKYERTNTVMKWWGWIYVGGIFFLGATSIGCGYKWVRWTAIAAFLLVNSYVYDVARYWIYTDKPDSGSVVGHHWYTKDDVNRDMFRYLKDAPYGIVLENIPKDAYSNSSIHAIFNGKPVLLGWPSHLTVWHGNISQVWRLTGQIREFYAGEKSASVEWLLINNVTYIVFGPDEDPANFKEINQQIQPQYYWIGFNANGQQPRGIWIRKSRDP